jgi:hypothetical protein
LFGPNGEDLTVATGSGIIFNGEVSHDNAIDRNLYKKNSEQFITHAPEPGPLTDFERKEAANKARAQQFIQNQGQLDTQRQTDALGFLPERAQTTPQSFQDVIAQTRRNQGARRQDQNKRIDSQRVAANEFRTQFERDEFAQIAPFIPERQRAAQARNLGLNPQTLQPINNTSNGLRSTALNGALSGAVNGAASSVNNPNNPRQNGGDNPFQQFAAQYKETTAAFGQNVLEMKKTIDEFNTSVKALTEKGINISIDRKGKIDVNINGIQVLEKIKGEMETEIRRQIADAINKNNQDKDNNGG